MNIYYFVGVLLTLCSSSVFAAGVSTNTTISLMQVQGDTESVWVVAADAPTTPASCSTTGFFHFSVPLGTTTGRAMYAALLVANTTGQQVSLFGTGGCPNGIAIEEMRTVRSLP